MEFNITLLVPLVTLIAALLAGAIAALTLIVNKENKVSEFRQAWIDGLREDLANFLSACRTCTRAVQEGRAAKNQTFNNPIPIDEGTTTKLRHQVAECIYRIKLRLNEKEEPHIKLEALLKTSTDLVSGYLSGTSYEVDQVFTGIEAAAEQAREVLKAEWTRVKKGEPAYQTSKRVASILATVAALVLVIGSISFFIAPVIRTHESSAKPASMPAAITPNPLSTASKPK